MSKSPMGNLHHLRRADVAFALTWAFSIGLGFVWAALAGEEAVSLFRVGLGCPPSPFGLLVAFSWPAGLVVLSVWFYGRRAILPLCGAKGLCYGFCAGCVVRAFGQAGFLAWFFLMFADTGMLWSLCWYCLRRFRMERCRMFWDLTAVLAAAALFGGLEHFVLSPFVEQVIF